MRHGKVKGIKGATTKNSERGKDPLWVGEKLVNPKPLVFPKLAEEVNADLE